LQFFHQIYLFTVSFHSGFCYVYHRRYSTPLLPANFAGTPPDMIEELQFTYRPIGILRSPYARRIDAPHQSTVVEGTETGAFATATLELADWLDEKVLQDLAGFDRLWLIFAFHMSEGWKSTVKPPRGGPKRGVLATRSPHRPNSIGLSAVELVKIEGRTLHLRGVDLLDGTPVLDIKPYVPYADAFPESKAGWIDELDAKLGRYFAPGPRKPR
jgi:tRNA (adenine37-N6)-methyltransferase